MDQTPSWLVLDRSAGDLEGQIHRGIRERILDGGLSAGERLPSTRALARSTGVSRATVVSAFERLRAEGFLEAMAGSATRVCSASAPPIGAPAPVEMTRPVAKADSHAPLRFKPGTPDLRAFPHRVWARCLGASARALRVLDLDRNEGQGLIELRRAILDHVSATRGVVASVEQVFIVPSTGAALDLLGRAFLPPPSPARATVWIEEPGYWVAQAVFGAAGARLVPLSCDAEGLDVAGASGDAPRLIYTTPSHQYPTGVTMSLRRRIALLEAARATGAIIIEDDYDSEFHFDARPIAALQGIDRVGLVAYIGTFSKTLAPGLRAAYIVLPRPLIDSFSETYALAGGTLISLHIQAALADFLTEGRLRAHLRRVKPLYAARMRGLVEALHRHCGEVLVLGDGNNGLQLAAWFRDTSVDDVAAAETLERSGFGMQPLSRFYLEAARPGLLFGVADVDEKIIDSDMQCIAVLLHRL